MSNFGEIWRIDGVTAAYITRGPVNGQYRVLFERSLAELADIEAIRWEHPTVELLRTDITGVLGLPEGYGFTVVDITYDHGSKSYTVTVQVASQYLGDVTGYEAQVAALEEQVADAQAQAAQKDETIAAQAQQIEALKADSGTALVESLEQAYEEGVESNG